jgi:hypothetical protein
MPVVISNRPTKTKDMKDEKLVSSQPQPQPFLTTTNVRAHNFTYGPNLGPHDLNGMYRS